MILEFGKLLKETFLIHTPREPEPETENKPKLTTYQLQNIKKLMHAQALRVAFKNVRKPHISIVKNSIKCPFPYDRRGAYCCESTSIYGIGETPEAAYKDWLAKAKHKLKQTDTYRDKYNELRKLYNVDN